ncbi:uncharacterized protein LOC129538953 [Moschus berezovskii]|uniref:uncharacterized protein LOC129538953 n=1 Tax=Moschus berezovskii TaxID=68408 RepID=UPI002443A2F8|nr:uncharacterized protein LOC129538953 [Moschus berezovskii]
MALPAKEPLRPPLCDSFLRRRIRRGFGAPGRVCTCVVRALGGTDAGVLLLAGLPPRTAETHAYCGHTAYRPWPSACAVKLDQGVAQARPEKGGGRNGVPFHLRRRSFVLRAATPAGGGEESVETKQPGWYSDGAADFGLAAFVWEIGTRRLSDLRAELQKWNLDTGGNECPDRTAVGVSQGKEQNSGPTSARIGTADTHRLPSEGDLHKGIHEVLIITHKRSGDIRHDAGVHLGQPFGFVESHVEPGPGPL